MSETVVVSDTSPLNYLLLCGAIDILPSIFKVVFVPPAVLGELRNIDAPQVVRDWAEILPAWVKIQRPTLSDPSLKLHFGEYEAICLAMEIHPDFILIDDRAARIAAKDRKLNIIGTLGVLEKAAENNLVDLPMILDRLAKTTFKIEPALVAALLERDASRKKGRKP
jgi:predicted nucleic acid-binding protein